MKTVKSIFAFLLILISLMGLSVTAFADNTYEHGSGKGDSAETAISVPPETKITGTCKEKYQQIYYSFEAPVSGRYWIQKAEGDYAPKFTLFNEKQKKLDDGSCITIELSAGTYCFSVQTPQYEIGSTYNFIITQYEEYGKSAAAGKEALFAAAVNAPLYEEVAFTTAQEKQELCYRFEVAETGIYQINKTKAEKSIGFSVFDHKFRKVDGGNDLQLELATGTYYVLVETLTNPAGSECSFIITKEGSAGWQKDQSNLADRFKGWMQGKQKPTFGKYASAAALFSVLLLAVVIFFAVFFPYKIIMQKKFGYNVFGLPFWLMMAGLAVIIILPLMHIDILGMADGQTIGGGVKGIIALLAIDIPGMVAMSVILFKKSRKIRLIPINIVMMHLFFYMAIIFSVYFIIVIVTMTMALIFTRHVAGSSSASGGVSAGSGTGMVTCPHCGRSRPAEANYCPHCLH